MNPLRLLDPHGSLTPKMWWLVFGAAVMWVFGTWMGLVVLRRANSHGPMPGINAMLLPNLWFVFTDGLISKHLVAQAVLLDTKPWKALGLLVLIAVGLIAIMWKLTDTGYLAFFSSVGLFEITVWSRRWSKRSMLFQQGGGSPAIGVGT